MVLSGEEDSLHLVGDDAVIRDPQLRSEEILSPECFVCGNDQVIHFTEDANKAQFKTQCELYKSLILKSCNLDLELFEEEACKDCFQQVIDVFNHQKSLEELIEKGEQVILLKLRLRAGGFSREDVIEHALLKTEDIIVNVDLQNYQEEVEVQLPSPNIDVEIGFGVKEEPNENIFLGDSENIGGMPKVNFSLEEFYSWAEDNNSGTNFNVRDPLASETDFIHNDRIDGGILRQSLEDQIRLYAFEWIQNLLVFRTCKKCRLTIFVQDDYKRKKNTEIRKTPIQKQRKRFAKNSDTDTDYSPSSLYSSSSSSPIPSPSSDFQLPPKKKARLKQDSAFIRKNKIQLEQNPSPIKKKKKANNKGRNNMNNLSQDRSPNIIIPRNLKESFNFPSKCSKCAQRFSAHSELLEHEFKNPLCYRKCPNCKIGFISNELLNLHIQKHHPSLSKLLLEDDSDDSDDDVIILN